ncbi:MAG: hypothetical protein CMP40_00900 [Rickettsiales bacterium]|nr:hypothetical protein [Rickettsiales bacterium]
MVKDIYIELNFKNNQDYRKKALESSYEIAFRRYLNWITLEKKADIEKIVADLVPKDYVIGYSIESEKFKKEKYSALISINFEKEKIEKLLISKNIKFYNKKGPKTLIIPLLNLDKRMVLWDDPNPWFQAWIRRPLDSNLTNFILPAGEVEDLITLNAEDANSLKYYKIKKLATSYEAVDALVLKIDLVLENNEYNYYLKAYDGLSQEEISISELNYIQTKNINVGLYNLSNEFANFYDDMWVKKNLAKIEAQSNKLLELRYDKFGQWLKIKEYLTNNDKVISFSILNLSNKKATINVNLISENLFLDDLTKNSYNVKKKSDNLLILNIE